MKHLIHFLGNFLSPNCVRFCLRTTVDVKFEGLPAVCPESATVEIKIDSRNVKYFLQVFGIYGGIQFLNHN